MVKKILRKISKNISKSQVDLVETVALSWQTQKSRKKSSCNSSTWSCRQVKSRVFLPRTKDKHSWVMPEMITSRNSRELILLQVSCIPILLIESETIYTSCCVSHRWVKSSEIDLESSLLFSTSVQLIGSYHGHKKPWFQSLSPSSKNSHSLILLKIPRFNSWSTWVTCTWWLLKYVTCISQRCVVKFISHQSHISAIFKLIRNCIWWSIRNLIFKNQTSVSVSIRSMRLQKPSRKWRRNFHKKRSSWKKPQIRLSKCWRNSKLSKEKLKRLRLKLVWLPPSVKEKHWPLPESKKRLKGNSQLPFPPKWELRPPLTHSIPTVSMKWRQTRNHQKSWSWLLTLSPFTSVWNWLQSVSNTICKSQEELQLTSGRIVSRRVVSSFWVQTSISWRTWRVMTRTESVRKPFNCLSHCSQQVKNGSMKTPQVRCQRPLLPLLNGCMQCMNIIKNLKSSSQRESSLLKKKPTCRLPNKNWKNQSTN